MADVPAIRTLRQGGSDEEFRRRVTTFFDAPAAEARLEAGDQAGGVRRLSLQVVDRLKQPFAGRWVVELVVAAAPGGTPAGTQALAAAASTPGAGLLWADADGRAARLVTDGQGRADVDVELPPGPAERWFSTAVVGRLKESGPVAWA